MNYYQNKLLKKLILLAFVAMALPALAVDKKADPASQICEAYADMQYPLARTLAAEHPKLPEARLVKALCAVYDRRKQALNSGLPELKKIYGDKNFKNTLRLQAGLAYARAGQTLQMRPGVYPEANGIDYDSIYDTIIAGHPNSSAACFAIAYQTEGWFTSGDKNKIEKAFEKLEDFLNNYKGPKRYLGALNVMLADRYIIHDRHYGKAVKHLVAALDFGISNPRTAEQILYRVGRTYDIKLHNRIMADKYYKEFLEKYPNSAYVTIIERYMKEMKTGRKQEHGNI
jgi:hypothetical protein